MAIRMSGLASGMDTESIVKALMMAKTAKKTKIEAKKTKLEWKQNIWSGLNTKLYNFYKDYAGKLRFQSNYQTKKATSSDTSKVTATAGSGATKGSHTLKVISLAAAQKVTGSKLGQYTTTETDDQGVTHTVQKDVSGSTKLTDLGFANDGSQQIQIKMGGADGKTISFNVDENTTVNDFVSKLQSAGLNASFDAKQGRFFISSKESGKDNGFTITSATLSGSQNAAQTALKNAIGYGDMSSDQQYEVQSVMSSLQNGTDADKVTAAQTKLIETVDANAKDTITEYYRKQKSDQLTLDYLGSDGKTLTAAGRQALKDANMDNDTYVDDDRVAALKSLITTKTSEYLNSDAMKTQIDSEVVSGLAAAGVDSKADRDIAINNAVANYATEVSGGVTADSDANSSLTKLGLANIYNGTAVAENPDGTGMVVVASEDSKIQLDGATITGSSTTMDVNGMTLNLIGVTDSEITLTVENDTSAVYDSIKEFINQYNSVLTEMNKYYYASSARDYDVLTDEEKEAMSDDEVEKWETKIKDSLLRRDSTLNGLLQTMRTSMTNTVITASNGKKYSLANLGITTGTDYKEYGLLHIKGDEDDTEYSDSANTLMNLLQEDPDVVAEVLSGITNKLYEDLQQKMKSTSLSSALTFYNDKEMNSQLSRYKDSITEWESKLADLEERYYKQFTAMEKAMSNLNSQQNLFSQYLGG